MIDSDGTRLQPGDDVQWERDGGIATGRVRCALSLNPDVALIDTRDHRIERVPFANLRWQGVDE